MTVTFFGHRTAPDSIKPKLIGVIEELIEHSGANVFYVGHQGNFDRIVLSALKEIKTRYPHIDYAVVLAHMPTERNELDDFETVYPEGLERTPRKFAIFKRNLWITDRCDTVVSYVLGPGGGAAKFVELAEKKGKRIINLAQMKSPLR